jgi:hypothetical protein
MADEASAAATIGDEVEHAAIVAPVAEEVPTVPVVV